MTFEVKVSKTDQWRVGTTLILNRSGDDSFCPVMAMRRLFLCNPAADTAPLFDFTPRQSNLPARVRCPGRARYRALFHAACSAVGLNPDKAQPHSLRMGGGDRDAASRGATDRHHQTRAVGQLLLDTLHLGQPTHCPARPPGDRQAQPRQRTRRSEPGSVRLGPDAGHPPFLTF